MNIRNDLKKLRKKAYLQLKDSIDRKVKFGGGYSEVYFTHLGQEPHRLPVAFSVPIAGPNSEGLSKRVLRGQRLLASKGITSPFVYRLLYFNDQGSKVSLKADSSLLDYLSTLKIHTMDMETTRRLSGQILLAVASLHEKNLVHRDLKLENFLMMERDGKVYLQAADLDDVCEVDSETHYVLTREAIVGTIDYFAPEVLAYLPAKLRKTPPQYYTTDLKAVDSYALGLMLQKILLRLCLPFKSPNMNAKDAKIHKHFQQLVSSLLKENPEERARIRELMIHPFFGDQPFLCEKFFQSLHNEAVEELSIDGYFCRYPAMNDNFHLLPSQLKPIVESAEILINQLIHMDEVADLETHALIHKAMIMHKKELMMHLLNALKEPSLESLLPEVEDVLETLQRELPDLTLTRLHHLVQKSVREFIEVNALDVRHHRPFKWFARYGVEDKVRANMLLADINERVVYNQPLQTVFKRVYDFILSDAEHAYSLSAILKRHLNEISTLPLAEWMMRLSSSPEGGSNPLPPPRVENAQDQNEEIPSGIREQIIGLSLNGIKLV